MKGIRKWKAWAIGKKKNTKIESFSSLYIMRSSKGMNKRTYYGDLEYYACKEHLGKVEY